MLRSVLVLVALGLLAAPSRASVIHVPSDLPTITDAIAAAHDGDVILVAPGTYFETPIIFARSLSIVGDGGIVSLRKITVLNTAPTDTVVLSGLLVVTPLSTLTNDQDAITCIDCAGPVRIQDCTALGDSGFTATLTSPVIDGYAGLRVQNCASVAATNCTLTGGNGANLQDAQLETEVPPGGPGVSVRESTVALLDCLLIGGNGGSVLDATPKAAGNGGPGVRNIDGTTFVSGCSLFGGDGGFSECDGLACGTGGLGGDGVRQVTPVASLAVRDNVFAPGEGGADGDGTPQPDGTDLDIAAGSFVSFEAPYRSFTLDSPLREGQAAAAQFTGVDGDLVFLHIALAPGYKLKTFNQGVYLNAMPLLDFFVGVMPAGGTLVTALTVPDLGPGVEDVTVYLQALGNAAGQILIDSARVQTLLDGAQ